MISKVFTVYDSKAEIYMPTFLFGNRGEAIRAFADTVNDVTTQLGKHPEDFTLFEVGEYDNSTGKYSQKDAHKSLGCAVEFLKESK